MAYVYNVCHRRDALQIYAVFTRTLIGSYPLFSAFYVQFVKKSHGRRQWWKWNVMILEMAKENVDELQFEYPRVWIRTIVVMVTSLDLSVFVPKSRNICNFYCKSLLLLLLLYCEKSNSSKHLFNSWLLVDNRLLAVYCQLELFESRELKLGAKKSWFTENIRNYSSFNI